MPPSKTDMGAILRGADEEFRIKLAFAASTGVRAGEQWATRWRDVDLKGQLHVSRRVDAYREEGAPKSAAGVRPVPISRQLTAMLKAWKLKSKFKSPEDPVFPNDEGNHINHDNLVKRRFGPLFDRLEVAHRADPARSPPPPRRFSWHALRQLAISSWIEAGVRAEDGADLRWPCFAASHDGQVRASVPHQDHKRAMDQIATGLFA